MGGHCLATQYPQSLVSALHCHSSSGSPWLQVLGDTGAGHGREEGPREGDRGHPGPHPGGQPAPCSAAQRIARCFLGNCFNPACLPGTLHTHECHCLAPGGLACLAPTGQQVRPAQPAAWLRLKAGVRRGGAQPSRPSSWLAGTASGAVAQSMCPNPRFHLEIGGCAASGLGVPAGLCPPVLS